MNIRYFEYITYVSRKAKRLNSIAKTAVWGGEWNTARAIKWTVRPSLAYSFAMTHIRDNDTSLRFAPDTRETGGVPAVSWLLKGQATVLWGYDAVPTAAQNIPLAGVRGKYGKITEIKHTTLLCL